MITSSIFLYKWEYTIQRFEYTYSNKIENSHHVKVCASPCTEYALLNSQISWLMRQKPHFTKMKNIN